MIQITILVISALTFISLVIGLYVVLKTDIAKIQQKLEDTCSEFKEVKNDFKHEIKDLRFIINNLKDK